MFVEILILNFIPRGFIGGKSLDDLYNYAIDKRDDAKIIFNLNT